ncbi:hypothetical protein HDV00_012077 [Rhizophlyctis rosea]|nr:hypothetical protein HDV00_012077 [Rhizophlyctis rosea]
MLGFSLYFGVLQEYYSTHADELNLGGSPSYFAVIGPTATGLLYLCSPITFTLLARWPYLRRWCGPLGLVLLILAFGLSTLATSINHLIATQGILSALGSGLLFAPSTLYLDEWFVQKKGLATAIMWSGKNVAGVVLPFAADAVLRRWGVQTMLWAWTVAVCVCTVPVLGVLKPRVPVSRVSAARPVDVGFLKMRTFWMLQIAGGRGIGNAISGPLSVALIKREVSHIQYPKHNVRNTQSKMEDSRLRPSSPESEGSEDVSDQSEDMSPHGNSLWYLASGAIYQTWFLETFQIVKNKTSHLLSKLANLSPFSAKELFLGFVNFIFFILGVAQTCYFLYDGSTLFHSIAVPLALTGLLFTHQTRYCYIVVTFALLVPYLLIPIFTRPYTGGVYFGDFYTKGQRVSFAVGVARDCKEPRYSVQAAEPLRWASLGASIQLFDAPLFADFRVIAFCRNHKEVRASNVYFTDGLTVYFAGANLPGIKSDGTVMDELDHRTLKISVPSANPYYDPPYISDEKVLLVLIAEFVICNLAWHHVPALLNSEREPTPCNINKSPQPGVQNVQPNSRIQVSQHAVGPALHHRAHFDEKSPLVNSVPLPAEDFGEGFRNNGWDGWADDRGRERDGRDESDFTLRLRRSVGDGSGTRHARASSLY